MLEVLIANFALELFRQLEREYAVVDCNVQLSSVFAEQMIFKQMKTINILVTNFTFSREKININNFVRDGLFDYFVRPDVLAQIFWVAKAFIAKEAQIAPSPSERVSGRVF